MGDRWMHYRDLPFSRAKRGICRWCGGEVQKPKLTWCSDRCVQEYMVRNNTGSARRAVFDRDHGECDGCGFQAGRLADWTHLLHSIAFSGSDHRYPGGRFYNMRYGNYIDWVQYRTNTGEAEAAGWIARELRNWQRDAWEADHIIPVIEGGGQCGLDNYRTLCVPCHKAETAKLAGRRAETRRAEKARADMPLFRGVD